MRRHDTDVVSLVFGTIFAGIAALWALIAGETMDADGLRVGAPAVLITAGLVGVLSSLGGRRPGPGTQAAGDTTAVTAADTTEKAEQAQQADGTAAL